ncbi:DUF5690 family protein [Asticcacaulis sp. SL142]|uniref:DUF5690 family protein n=1 Tax=Asticcacaulis sp. SL142 TaxID=2995155 RepID=UPI00226C650C|nr:DUF5690 family protein [Asticcacaulis sp. SL142]WAC49821.1 DUF5690 family protein [Asticcacaulis sp. SL142]
MASASSRTLPRASHVWVGLYALSAAFITYFCMYAFRKPFSAATYENVAGWPGFFDAGIDFKIAAVIAQVLGYATSKLIGIKIVSEAGAKNRAAMILGFIAVSWVGLILFAVVPGPWKLAAIFLNGLPLGMIWGLVFAYLEGRRMSEILGAGLCVSFIVSSGAVKAVGRAMIVDYGVPELWMPALTGALFMPIMALSVWALSRTPPPDARDIAERVERRPMFKAERKAFIAATGFGLLMLVVAYVVLTALRDFRDNFAVELWGALGYGDVPSVFALSELPVAGLVLILFALTALIRDNRQAVLVYHVMIIAGAVAIAGATFAFQAGWLGPVGWMIAVGAGVYMGYVPYNAVLADRLTAAIGVPGNAAFFMYVADASGYGGSVALMLIKNFTQLNLSWQAFFSLLCYGSAAVVALATAASLAYFSLIRFGQKKAKRPDAIIASQAADN